VGETEVFCDFEQGSIKYDRTVLRCQQVQVMQHSILRRADIAQFTHRTCTMEQVRNLFEQCEHGRGRVTDQRQHFGFATNADARRLGRDGVALIDIRKQRTLGEKLARSPRVNRHSVTGGEMPNHAEPPAQDVEYRRRWLALSEQRLIAVE